MVERTAAFLAEARRRGVPVVHAPLVVDPKNKKGLFAHVTLGMFFRKGTLAAEVDPRVAVAGDLVIRGRTAFDAFVNSDLEQRLTELRAAKLFVLGFVTNQCVAKTMVTAKELGFDPVMISDCTATWSTGAQQRAERRFHGRAMRSDEVWSCV